MGEVRSSRYTAPSVTLLAPAKINLHLGIYPCPDEDGYHRVDTVMVALDAAAAPRALDVAVASDALGVADEVTVRACPGQELRVCCEPALEIPQEKNTVWRAATELARAFGRAPEVDILVRKRVPSQAGLGGGSSDAAATLLALCRLWDIDAHDERVAKAARSVGADVAFFLDPRPTFLTGRGDVVVETFAPLQQRIPVVLVRPAGEGVSTPAAYRAFDERPCEPADAEPLRKLLRSSVATAEDIAAMLYNNLSEPACRLQPAVGEAIGWLEARPEVLGAQVCGSGSCAFAVCATIDAADAVAHDAVVRFGMDSWVRTASFC